MQEPSGKTRLPSPRGAPPTATTKTRSLNLTMDSEESERSLSGLSKPASPNISSKATETKSTGSSQPRFTDLYELTKKLVAVPGSPATVYAGKILENDSRYGGYGTPVAVKVTDVQDGNKAILQAVRWELKGLERAGGHINVLRGYECIIEKKPPNAVAYLVSELCNTDMFVATESKLSQDCYFPLFKQMVAAVRHVHKQRICHRDIKLENFFLVFPNSTKMEDIHDPDKVHNFTVKLGDFGFWTKSHDSNGDILLHYSHCGSDVYSAPEQALKTIANKVGYDGQKADIFSLGVCLFVLHNGYPPWNTNRKLSDPYNKLWVRGRVADYWRAIDYHTPEHLRPSMAFRDLVSRMMSVDPDKRPTLDEVMSHPFVTGEGADDVYFKPNNHAIDDHLSAWVQEALVVREEADLRRNKAPN